MLKKNFTASASLLIFFCLIGVYLLFFNNTDSLELLDKEKELPEMVGLRTENSRTYDLGNGEKRLVISENIQHWKYDYNNPNEQWKEIDLTWDGSYLGAAPYELWLEGNKLTFSDRKTGEVSILELLDVNLPGLEYEIVPHLTGVSFQHVVSSEEIPFEAKFKVTGSASLVPRAYDDKGELVLETTFQDGILTEKLSQTMDKETGQARLAQGPIRIDPILETRVGAGENDGYRESGGWWPSLINNYTYIAAGGHYSSILNRQYIREPFMLFNNVNISQGVTINDAYLRLRAFSTNSVGAVNLIIRAENTDNASVLTDYSDYGSRSKTPGITWDNVGAWTANNYYNSPDISSEIQAVINRSGWSFGNNMQVFIMNNGSTLGLSNCHRMFYSYEGSVDNAPQLVIDYMLPPCEEHNVWGWAWSSNIGWISFSCENESASGDYGVDIDENGIFSGYAWSEHIGWVTFNEDQLMGCPSGDCRAWVEDDGRVYGWARAYRAINSEGQTLGGWTGWIKFDHEWDDEIYIDEDGNFHGYAWGGGGQSRESAVIGWVDFTGVKTNFSFEESPNAPNTLPITWDDCGRPKETSVPTFSWTYSHPDGIDQKGYHIKVYNEAGDKILDHPDEELVSTSYTDSVWAEANLDFEETEYFWQVSVLDVNNNWSDWSAMEGFQTRPHAHPWVGFNWTPPNPTIDYPVQFCSIEDGACSDEPSEEWSECFGSFCDWEWSFPGIYDCEFPLDDCEEAENPLIDFSDHQGGQVELKICDITLGNPVHSTTGGCCDKEKEITLRPLLPKYKEVAPTF